MKTTFAHLSKEEQHVLANLKATLALRLAEEVFRLDSELRERYPARARARTRAMTIRIAGANPALAIKICFNSAEDSPIGMARAVSSRPSLVLFFPGAASAVKVLSGLKGIAIPLPLRPGAFEALDIFRSASRNAMDLLQVPETPERVKARLLLTATLYGIEAIAQESYLQRRMQIIPDGIVHVIVQEDSFSIHKQGDRIEVHGSGAHRAQNEPNDLAYTNSDARLIFVDYRSAMEVLSGKREAVVALGSGHVRIEGLLPLVQGLFAVLDRLSWYMGVEA